jgi:hypothetical protein
LFVLDTADYEASTTSRALFYMDLPPVNVDCSFDDTEPKSGPIGV